jgi:hypothetical protein
MAKQNFQEVYDACDEAGRAAADATTPMPMTVVGHGERYHVPAGVCGFAWIQFPGNTAWGRWATKQGLASNGYPSGKCIRVFKYNQSMELKEAYARAFASKLNELVPNARAYSMSRID